MPTVKKIDIVERLAEDFKTSNVAISTKVTGLSVNQLNSLRSHLRTNGLSYKVIKNTLANIAADNAGKPEFKELLDGPTGLVIGEGDPIESLKLLVSFAKNNELDLSVFAIAMDGQTYDSSQINTLVKLPSRIELIAKLVGMLASQPQRLVTALAGPSTSIVTILSNVLNQKKLEDNI